MIAEGKAVPGSDALTTEERDHLAGRDGFVPATVSETGWRYVQFRSSTAGVVRVVDDDTRGWADFGGDLQYISTGNLVGAGRVAMDYVHRRRLKCFTAAELEPHLAPMHRQLAALQAEKAALREKSSLLVVDPSAGAARTVKGPSVRHVAGNPPMSTDLKNCSRIMNGMSG